MTKFLQEIREFLNSLFKNTNQKLIPQELQNNLSKEEDKVFESSIKGFHYNTINEQKWSAKVRNYFRKTSASFKRKISGFYTKLDAINFKLNMSEEERLKRVVSKLKPLLDEALDKIHKKFDNIEQKMKGLFTEQIENQVKLDNITRNFRGSLPEEQTFLDTTKALIITILAITLGEATLSFSAVDILLEQDGYKSYATCIVMSLAIGVCCHLFGYSLANKNNRGILASLTTGSAFVLFIILMRFQTENLIDETNPWLLGLANILMFGFGLLLGWRTNRFYAFFEAKNNEERITKQIGEEQLKLEARDRKIQNTTDEFTALAQQTLYQEEASLIEDRRAIELHIADSETQLKNHIEEVKLIIDDGILTLKTAYQRGQNLVTNNN